jgi:hypothetical protein
MSQDIDFIMPDLKTIERPPLKPAKPAKSQETRKAGSKSFQI